MMTAQDIKNKALECGACRLIEETSSIADLVALMRTPQGREFCKKHRFPTLDILREYKDALADMGVFVDAGIIDVANADNLIVAGDTLARVRYDKTDKPYHVIVMADAKVIVNACDYATCEITLIGGEAQASEWNNASVFMR